MKDYKSITDKIFLSYDIRGIYPEVLDEETAERIGLSFGTIIGANKTVCIGQDVRNTSEKIIHSFINGILKTGCNVLQIDILPNPFTYFYTWKNNLDAGCYVTASHNPPEYTGFKFIRKTGVSFIDELDKLKKIFIEGNFISGKGNLEKRSDAYLQYVNFWKDKIKIDRKIKIVTDSLYASASTVIPKIFEEFGIECTAIKNEPKGDLNGERPEPDTRNTAELSERIKKEKADFGAAYDGDADRSMFIDNLGIAHYGGEILTLFAKGYAGLNDKVVVTIDCPSEVAIEIKKTGAEVLWAKIGHGFIEEEVFQKKAVFGGEQSSHFYPGKFYVFSDGIANTLLLADFLSKQEKKMSELLSELKISSTEKIYISAGTHEIKNKVMEKLKKKLSLKYPNNNTMDGIKIYLNDIEWVLIRVSNNAPELNLCIEGKNKERISELMDNFSAIIKEEVLNEKNISSV